MRIDALYVKSTNEIIYSRSRHDYMQASDGSCAIDGGREYTKVCGNEDSFVMIQLDGEKLLDFILNMDYQFGTSNAAYFKDGFHGRFEIVKSSSKGFYKRLIVDFEKVEELIDGVVGRI